MNNITFKKLRDFGIGVIVEKDGKILMLKEKIERPEIGKAVDMYSFPMRHPYNDESLEEAIVRETFEETGYKIKVTSILGFYDFYKAFGIVYRANLTEDNQYDFNHEEVQHVVWINPEDILQQKVRPAVKESIEDFLHDKSFSLDIINICKV